MAHGISRQESKAATRQRIFRTALELFREKGFEATTVEDIVRRAGVSKGTYFFHFPAKERVFGAYVDALTEDMLPHLEQWLDLPPLEALWTALDGLTDRAQQDRPFLRHVIYEELFGPPDQADQSSLYTVFAPLVEAARIQGQVRSDLPVSLCVQHILSNYLIALAWALCKNETDLFSALQPALRLALEGILPR